MVSVELSPEYGYVLLVLVGFVILQYVVLTTLVVRQRMSTGIAAPILYPRDSVPTWHCHLLTWRRISKN